MNGLQPQPAQRLLCRAYGGAGGRLRPVDQDDRAAQLPRGGQLGRGPQPTRVFAHHVGNSVPLHQGQVIGQREGAAVDHHGAPVVGQHEAGVDQAQQAPVVGLFEEGLHMLPADGQKNARRAGGQGRQSGCQIGHRLPLVTGLRLPGRSHQRQQRQFQFAAGLHHVSAHLGSKGVRRIDCVGDGFGLQVVAQTFNAAKAAHPGGQGLGHWRMGAPGIRKHGTHPGPGERLGQPAGFGGAAQQEDTLHA